MEVFYDIKYHFIYKEWQVFQNYLALTQNFYQFFLCCIPDKNSLASSSIKKKFKHTILTLIVLLNLYYLTSNYIYFKYMYCPSCVCLAQSCNQLGRKIFTLHRLISSYRRNWRNCYKDKIMVCSYHYSVCMVNYLTSDNMNFICL
jgi:hypothetical protein